MFIIVVVEHSTVTDRPMLVYFAIVAFNILCFYDGQTSAQIISAFLH